MAFRTFGEKKERPSGGHSRETNRHSRYDDPEKIYGDPEGTYEDPEGTYGDSEFRRRTVPRQGSGYGVGDSYDRQSEFGRPEGYGRQGEPYPEEQFGETARGSAGRKTPRWENDPYDDRYTGSYEEFDEPAARKDSRRKAYGEDMREGGRYGDVPRRDPGSGRYGDVPRRGRGSDRYGDVPRRDMGSARYDDVPWRRQEDPFQERTAAGRRRDAPRGTGRRPQGRKSGKGAFIAKLVLLIIAAVLLFGFYRFSRMDRVHLGTLLKNEGAGTGEGYQTFVIYGVDSREGQLTKDSHSDTIVILSINRSTKEAKMVSVYRDTYLDNTNGEYRKATECYFFGGPERSINMLNKNLDLDIEDYIAVNFNAVVKAVDLIGGVDINVTEDELPYINGYQTENAQVTGAEITPVTSAGYQHLNGIQALAYCRIRYTAGDDYRRTQRQRDVLTQIFENAKKEGTTKMLQVADAMMPYISTSFSNTEIMNLVSEMSDLTLGDSAGFPFEQQAADTASGDCVVPVSLSANVKELHAFLFGQNDYTPSQTVQEISQQIVNNTGIG